MKSANLYSATRSILLKKIRTLVSIGISLLIVIACTNEPDASDPNDPNNPNNPNTPGSVQDPDYVAEHLVFQSAAKLMGNLASPADGQLRMNFKDSIFFVKGHPLGQRILVSHDPSQQVKGFYVQIKNAAFYFDVEEILIRGEAEGDSTSNFILDLDLPEEADVVYPFVADVIIQPHDEAGAPLDEFTRKMVVEDPEITTGSGCNDIRRPPAYYSWEWQFTIRQNSSGISLLSAPGLIFDLGDKALGCCNGWDHTVWPPFEGCNDKSEYWVEMPADLYYKPLYELLWLWDDGSAEIKSQEAMQTLDKSNTDLCSLQPAYFFSNPKTNGEGTHNFTPGATTLHLDFPGFSGFSKPPADSQITYTCHVLVMSYGSESDIFHKVYQLNGSDEPSIIWTQWFE